MKPKLRPLLSQHGLDLLSYTYTEEAGNVVVVGVTTGGYFTLRTNPSDHRLFFDLFVSDTVKMFEVGDFVPKFNSIVGGEELKMKWTMVHRFPGASSDIEFRATARRDEAKRVLGQLHSDYQDIQIWEFNDMDHNKKNEFTVDYAKVNGSSKSLFLDGVIQSCTTVPHLWPAIFRNSRPLSFLYEAFSPPRCVLPYYTVKILLQVVWSDDVMLQ